MAGLNISTESLGRTRDSLPADVKKIVKNFHESISHVESALKPLLCVPYNNLVNKLEPLAKARIDLMIAYTVNSMYWMYLNTQGENAKDHQVKEELERIRKYMNKVKEIIDHEKAAKFDKGAAKRFVTHALYDPKDRQQTNAKNQQELPLARKRRVDNKSQESLVKQRRV